MTKPQPRCPKGKLAKQVCVTQKCTLSPFICQECAGSQCEAAHRYCKIMRWDSVYDMLKNYRKSMPVHYVNFMGRVEKIYNNLQQKINREIKLFRQYIETEILSPQYMKLMHFLHVEQYDNITCKGLSTVFEAMTSKPPQIKAQTAEKFTLNEMRTLDNSIAVFLRGIEDLYKGKFGILQKQVRQKMKKGQKSYKQANLSRSQTLTKISNKGSYNYSPDPKTKMSQSAVNQKNDSKGMQNKSGILLNSNSNKSNFLVNSEIIERPRRGSKLDLDYPKHINSKAMQNATVMNHLVGKKVKEYKLIYRGSENGFKIEDFYRKMANTYYNRDKQEITTLIIIKTQYGKVLGGSTKLKWIRQVADYDDDEENQKIQREERNRHKADVRGGTFLFSCDLNQRYELKNPSQAIYCGNTSIGFGHKDLRIVNEGHKYSKNYVGFPDSFNNGNYLRIKKSSLMLTGSKDSAYFRINQWEAFEIEFKGI